MRAWPPCSLDASAQDLAHLSEALRRRWQPPPRGARSLAPLTRAVSGGSADCRVSAAMALRSVAKHEPALLIHGRCMRALAVAAGSDDPVLCGWSISALALAARSAAGCRAVLPSAPALLAALAGEREVACWAADALCAICEHGCGGAFTTMCARRRLLRRWRRRAAAEREEGGGAWAASAHHRSGAAAAAPASAAAAAPAADTAAAAPATLAAATADPAAGFRAAATLAATADPAAFADSVPAHESAALRTEVAALRAEAGSVASALFHTSGYMDRWRRCGPRRRG